MPYGYTPRTVTTVLTYITEAIEDFNEHSMAAYASYRVFGGKLVGARCYKATRWHNPTYFSKGRGCKDRIHQAYKDGFIEIKVTHKS